MYPGGNMPIDRSLRILIVDDYQSMRRMLADIMRAAGFRNIDYAESGKQAWRKLNEEAFGLVLLDWNMPGGSGLDLLKAIRRSETMAELPVLMVTAEAEQDQVVAAISEGVSSYIVKPYTPNTVYKKVQQVMGEKL